MIWWPKPCEGRDIQTEEGTALIAEIVSTGTELLLGEIVNTNAAYVARRLNEEGVSVYYETTVGDNPGRLDAVLRQALSRAELVVTTGGLGPTQGDITRQLSADVLGLELVEHPETVQRLQRFFAQRKLPMPAGNLRQAQLPPGALVLPNACGTAPGTVMVQGGKVLINLPGPPAEMQAMLDEQVLPWLRSHRPDLGCIRSQILRCVGVGESLLEEKLMDLVRQQGNPTLAFLARSGEMLVRITAQGASPADALERIRPWAQEVRRRLGEDVISDDDATLEEVVGRELLCKGWSIAVAESCTAGLIAARLANVSGASRYLQGGIVAYDNRLKEQLLGVPPDVLARHGAVSQETAEAMAIGVRRACGVEVALAVTGIAGPGGGSEEKPVGLVHMAVVGPWGCWHEEGRFYGSRQQVRAHTEARTLALAVRYLRQFDGARQGQHKKNDGQGSVGTALV